MPEIVTDKTPPAMNIAPKLLWDVQESAARLSMSVVSVRKMLRQGRLKRVPGFRKILISDNELRQFAAGVE